MLALVDSCKARRPVPVWRVRVAFGSFDGVATGVRGGFEALAGLCRFTVETTADGVEDAGNSVAASSSAQVASRLARRDVRSAASSVRRPADGRICCSGEAWVWVFEEDRAMLAELGPIRAIRRRLMSCTSANSLALVALSSLRCLI